MTQEDCDLANSTTELVDKIVQGVDPEALETQYDRMATYILWLVTNFSDDEALTILKRAKKLVKTGMSIKKHAH